MEDQIDIMRTELSDWKKRMTKDPSFTGALSKKMQDRINAAIPQKVHDTITAAIRQMTRAMIFGAELTTFAPLKDVDFEVREREASRKIDIYIKTATAEGAITGAGGILLGLADFPLWLGLKMKMLSEIAALYGKDLTSVKERIFILYIFQLTFSSARSRKHVFNIIENWHEHEQKIDEDINAFDWQTFQQEYRDFIDIAKLLQLVPGIGAAVGAVVNHRLTAKLGRNALNAYRLRHLNSNDQKE